MPNSKEIKLAELHKYFCESPSKSNLRCWIYRRCYDSRISYFDDLTDVIEIISESVGPKHMQIKHYGGDTIRGIFGIEFDLPLCKETSLIDNGWEKCLNSQLPSTL